MDILSSDDNSPVRSRYILRAAIGYAVLAALWILFSDQLLFSFTDLSKIKWLSMAKGITFVIISASGCFMPCKGSRMQKRMC